MKNIVKAVAVILLAAVAAASFAACHRTVEPAVTPAPAKDYNVDEIAASVAANVPFEDPYLANVANREFALSTYGIDAALVADENGEKASSIYVSGAYPEMIVAIKAVDEASAAAVMDKVKALIDNYIKNYTTYTPEQVAKLESAVTVQRGAYVFAIVSNDNAAAESYLSGLLG
jgi:hypothetical protein